MTTFRSFSSHLIAGASALALSFLLISGTVSVPMSQPVTAPASEYVA